MRVQKIFLILLLLPVFVVMSSCEAKSKSAKKTHIIVAKLETPVQQLYFTGTLNPIKTLPVVSPVAGNIVSMNFTYGERIQNNQLLFVISSSALAESYRKAINDYLQKKQSYVTSQQNFAGMNMLYDAGAIARNDYETNKTQLDNAKLNFLQAQYDLERVLHTANVDSEKIEKLTISDTNEVNKLLQRRFRHVEIFSPGAGIALFPAQKSTSGGSGSDATSGKLTVGSTVKQDELLLSIGDLTGLSAEFNVSEVDIYRIYNGMSVKVTGSAFPGKELHGVISAVSAQANQGGSSDGLSMYAVSVKIPNVEPKTMERIRVGMTAKFEVDIDSQSRIMLPLQAVQEKNGMSYVTILDASGKEKEVTVVTGRTTMTDVVVENGIKVGDKVVVHD